MKLLNLYIQNYKSIKRLEIDELNPFSAFIGPNGAGKSNIFEAIEFCVYLRRILDPNQVVRLFKGKDSVFSYNPIDNVISIQVGRGDTMLLGCALPLDGVFNEKSPIDSGKSLPEIQQPKFLRGCSRIFLNNPSIKKVNIDDNSALSLDGSNLEKVLSRILQDDAKREEIIEWLQVMVPEFKDIQIETSKLSGDINYVIFEKHTNKPFPKHLISDGTKNILALLAAVYQSDEPQFLCIEEPENGLHPYVIENMVSLFRNACKERGHYIWLNTHSQTLVRHLTAGEIIVVEKKQGETKVRQFKSENLQGLQMDEAWLTNALGGGLP